MLASLVLFAALASASVASASVKSLSETQVWGEDADFHAAGQVLLDIPRDQIVLIFRDVADYAKWVPTVSWVNVTWTGESEVHADFKHAIPIVPDFPCEVIIHFVDTAERFTVTVQFIKCLFDDQSFMASVVDQGSGTVLDLGWSARLKRWYVPGAALRAYLRTAIKNGPKQLDGYAHEMLAGAR